MYTRKGPKPAAFDSVVVVEGGIKYNPAVDHEPVVTLKLAYLNSKTQTTYGSCDFSNFTPKTMEAFRHFLELAEADYGQIVWEEGQLSPFGTAAKQGIESDEGLPIGLGGS